MLVSRTPCGNDSMFLQRQGDLTAFSCQVEVSNFVHLGWRVECASATPIMIKKDRQFGKGYSGRD
jgi:hypothetical protein